MPKVAKYKRFHEDIYQVDVYLFYRQDRDASIELMKKKFHDFMGNPNFIFDNAFNTEGALTYAYQSITQTWRRKVFILWFPEKLKTGTLVHEIFHLCDYILDSRGVSTFSTDMDNNEHFAYYIDYWSRKVNNYCSYVDKKK